MRQVLKGSLSVAAFAAALLGFGFAQERFDLRIRTDFFAGFAGDEQALARAMKICEEELAKNPANAEALVWHGSGIFFRSGKAFQSGDSAQGAEFNQRGLKEMADAVRMAPDNLGVRIPRGAVLLTASRRMPSPDLARPLIETGLLDFERALHLQSGYFDTLGVHPRGELLLGLADGYARLGQQEKAAALFERIRSSLPGTPYAASAEKWAATKTLSAREGGCLGCHASK